MYVTFEELNDIIPTLFTASELESVKWSELSDDDKRVLINRATSFIDGLHYLGKYCEEGQSHAFPRIINDMVITADDEDVKFAAVCYIFSILDTSVDARYKLQKQGVKSWSSGDESESYELGSKYAPESINLFKGYLSSYLYDNEF